MEVEVFASEREFYEKFPSGFFICSNCGYLTNNKKECPRCKWRADGLFKTMNRGYKYKIMKENISEEIFKPIELEKGNK